MSRNRPYAFELAALAVSGSSPVESLRTTSRQNGVDLAELERAIVILRTLQRSGDDPDDFVLREYIIDGWLQGYLPLDVPSGDPTLTTWRLAQLANAHYRGHS